MRLSDLRAETIPITTAGDFICSSLQSWEIENTDAANSIFIHERRAATASASDSTEVAAGETRLFFFDPRENPIISMIAATAAVTALVRRETFRSRLRWSIARYGAISAQRAASLWRRVSATVVELSAGYTTWRARSGVDAIIQNDQGNNAFTAGNGANGNAIVQSDGTGAAQLSSSDGADLIRQGVNGADLLRNSATRMAWTDTETNFQNMTTGGVVGYDGAGTDPRHTLSSAHRVLHTPVAGGGIDSVLDCWELPPVNATVIAVGDYVMKVAGTQRVTPATTTNTTMPVLGICVVGATGNAGGTTFARIAFFGQVASLIADNAGVVDGQFIKPGTTTANEAESQTTPSLITFGRADATAASTVAFSAKLRAMG